MMNRQRTMAVCGLPAGKKICGKTSEAAVARMKKS
jgi:hypothetical protein